MKQVMKLDGQVILGVIITALIAFKLLAGTIGELRSAGDEVQTSGAPLGTFFGGDGVLILAFMAGIVLVAVRMFVGGKGKYR